MDLYEYSIIRLVPDIEREEFINIGLIMMCKRKRWISIQFAPLPANLRMLFPFVDIDNVLCHINSFKCTGEGKRGYGPIAQLETEERFRWLTAVKSAVIQTSRPHPGLTDSLTDTFNSLYTRLVIRDDKTETPTPGCPN